MAQQFFATQTAPGLGALDANFSELYDRTAPLSVAGGYLLSSAPFELQSASPVISLRCSAAGQPARLFLKTGAQLRWVCGKDAAAESGANAGSDFFVSRVLDDGVTAPVAFKISRADGRIWFGGSFAPLSDNAYSVGASTARISVVYAATGTINTSDARDKTAVQPLSSAEIGAAADLARAIGSFQFLQAVACKGDGARVHIGLTVQRAIEILRRHGLEPMRYAFICHDEWAPAGADDRGDRFGFRADQLMLFIARGLEARLAALEQAAAAAVPTAEASAGAT